MHHPRFIINLIGKKSTRFFYRRLKIKQSQVSSHLCSWELSDAPGERHGRTQCLDQGLEVRSVGTAWRWRRDGVSHGEGMRAGMMAEPTGRKWLRQKDREKETEGLRVTVTSHCTQEKGPGMR